MKNFKTSILLLPLLLLIINTFAQQNQTNTTFILSGKVINPETKKGIAFAHIKIEDSSWGKICDSLGFFHLRVHHEKNLVITAIGYKMKIYNTGSHAKESEIFVEIPMQQESYMIQEISVYHPGTWAEFKSNFLSCKLSRDTIASIMNIKSHFGGGNRGGTTLHVGKGGIGAGFGINNSAKKRKAMQKVQEMKISESKRVLLAQKYNRQMVGLLCKESGKRLDALMAYINDRNNFTYQTSAYYIGCRVKQLYGEFLKKFPPLKQFNDLTLSDTVNIPKSLFYEQNND